LTKTLSIAAIVRCVLIRLTIQTLASAQSVATLFAGVAAALGTVAAMFALNAFLKMSATKHYLSGYTGLLNR
jgi:hypothetical protein